MNGARAKSFLGKVLLIAVALAIPGCASAPQEDKRIAYRDCAAFVADEINLPVTEDTNSQIVDAIEQTSSIRLLRNLVTSSDAVYGELITVDAGDSIQLVLPLTNAEGNPLSGNLLCADGDKIYVLAKEYTSGITELLRVSSDGKTIEDRKEVPLDSGVYCMDFLVRGEDVILLCDNKILVYRDSSLLKETTIPGSLIVEQISEDGGVISFLYGDNEEQYMGKWNYLSGTLEKTKLAALRFDGFIGWCKGNDGFYANSTTGIYRLDEEKDRMTEILSWNDTDIPPTRYTYNATTDYVLSDNTVLRVVSPVSGQSRESLECQLMTHTDKNPAEGKTILTIGGYYASTDSVLAYAVYQFNKSNETYRVEIQDYNELYPFSGLSGYNQALTAIIADMTKGKGQDILYGNVAFNYNKLDENGLLLDMMPYLDQDANFSEDAFLPSIYELMNKDGSMYFFFPSFSIRGYITSQDYFPAMDSITCKDILAKKRDTTFTGTVFPGVPSKDLLRGALLYSLDDYLDVNGNFAMTAEELEVLIQYASEAGALSTEVTLPNTEEAFLLGQQAMLNAYIFCPQDYYRYQQLASSPLIYVGYPAQEQSERFCSPNHQIAISSGSKYPDACWEFVKIMMSPEVQQKTIELNSIPVSTAAFDSLIEKAQNPELRTPAENTALDLTVQTAIPASTIEEFRALVDSINAMEYYDTVLTAIIDETCAPCLTGEKTAAQIVDELNDRINLYLQE